MEYAIHLLILIGIYLIFAQSFNLIFGLGRLFNLAHVAVYAIGAYTTALLSTEVGAGFWICILASMLTSGVLALLLGGISLKLSEDYFAIGSLAFSFVVSSLLTNWKSVTKGVLGIPGIPRPEIFGVDFYQNYNFLCLVYACVLVSYVPLYLLFNNSFGRILRAQSEFNLGAISLGRDTRLIRNLCFFMASVFVGLAGALFAYYLNYIDPSSFSLSEMIFVFTIVIVGRPGSFFGTIAATVFLILLPESLRFVEISPSILGPMRQMLYAIILFVVVYLNRRVLFPVVRRI